MENIGWPPVMGKRNRYNLNSLWGQQGGQLTDSFLIAAIAVADSKRIFTQPRNITSFQGSRYLDFPQQGYTVAEECLSLGRRFAPTRCFSHITQDHSAVGGKGCIPAINGIHIYSAVYWE